MILLLFQHCLSHLNLTSMLSYRLSEQLTVLPKLMQPVVAALKGPPTLVRRALKVLDSWIDSLNPEFLEPAMAPVSRHAFIFIGSHPEGKGLTTADIQCLLNWHSRALQSHSQISYAW